MQTKLYPGNDTLVVFITENEENEELIQALPFSFLMVSSHDWNRELSPWPAKKVFKGGGDFQGEADSFLNDLLKNDVLQQKWSHRILCGYSLAGLFAVYACTKTDLFDGCASVSGSLWFPDFIEYLKKNPVHAKNVYLSLGDLEKNSKQFLLSTVEDRTKEVQQMLTAYTSVTFEMNQGNHFQDPNDRVIKALKTFNES